MTTRPTVELRRQVVERAGNCCEYCLLLQELAASTHQVDHVIAEKHGGQTAIENLALSCTVCNRRKGSDLSSLDPVTGTLVPLFNPRTQSWSTHVSSLRVHFSHVNQGRHIEPIPLAEYRDTNIFHFFDSQSLSLFD